MDCTRWIYRTRPALRWPCVPPLRLRLLRPLQFRLDGQPRRARGDMAHGRRAISLRLRPLHRQVEARHGMALPSIYSVDDLTRCRQSFWVGWTNIVGWLVVVTVQGFFAGSYTALAVIHIPDICSHSPIHLCSIRRGLQRPLRRHSMEHLPHLPRDPNLRHRRQHLGQQDPRALE